ncbi:MAG: hypothetical protein K2G70_02275, partial [Turicibacter sp.]|nr:hypothetical protein [Turicibacter sp.]
QGTQEKPIEITEKLFLLQINDVFFNFKDYEGSLLKVEGMYGTDIILGEEFHVVYRFGPGCCENDDWAGFFLNYDGEWPEQDEWIEVIGTPRIVQGRSAKWLYLDVTSLVVKEERGAETVSQ